MAAAALKLSTGSLSAARRIPSLLQASFSNLLKVGDHDRIDVTCTPDASSCKELATARLDQCRRRLLNSSCGADIAAPDESVHRSMSSSSFRSFCGSMALPSIGAAAGHVMPGRMRGISTTTPATGAVKKVTGLDHVVLTVQDIDATCRFYSQVLGMEVVKFGAGGRVALAFGEQKINLHQVGKEFEPKAHRPTSGSADLCFITDTPLEMMQSHVEGLGVTILQGPVARTGAKGPIRSIYFRDPDQNLLEVANYD